MKHRHERIDGPFLGILDGQFFIIDEFSLEQRTNKNNIISTNGDKFAVAVATEINVSIKTERAPKHRMHKTHKLWIVTQNKRVRIDDFQISKCGAVSMGDNRSVVEGSGLKQTVTAR